MRQDRTRISRANVTEPNESTFQEYETLIGELAAGSVSVAQTRRLHESLGEPWSSLVLSSAQWQKKANEKLGNGLWWTTDRALQQSTPWQVAKRKASWFDDTKIYDLCCGIGGDAVHLNGRAEVVAVDSDPSVCAMAKRNLANHAADCPNEVVVSDVSDIVIPSNAWVHIDPDRRVGEKRTSTPDFYSPDWPTTTRIAKQSRGALIKLAPAAQLESPNDTPFHRVWISLQGTVREQSLILGELVERFALQAVEASSEANSEERFDGNRSALVIQRDESHCFFTGDADAVITSVAKPLEMMVDPDAAIRGAGLTGSFATAFGLSAIGGASGFLTGSCCDTDSLTGLAICEEVIWSGSCDDRKLRRELRTRNLYPKRIKTRGAQQDPNKMEKKLRECGDEPITLWIGRSGKGHYAAFTRTSGT